MHKYATTTPEARELVSELEFVWDQIKSNSASSAGSSPGQAERRQGQQIINPSYASIGGPPGQRSGTVDRSDGGGLRMLRPVSDRDEGENANEEEDFQEARSDALDAGDGEANFSGAEGLTRHLDARNHKWRKRIEQALVKMTTEVAALREQVEAKHLRQGRKRDGLWAWLIWLVWAAIRHALVNLAILGVLVAWARRKRDRRVEMSIGLLMQYAGEQVRKLLRPIIPAAKNR